MKKKQTKNRKTNSGYGNVSITRSANKWTVKASKESDETISFPPFKGTLDGVTPSFSDSDLVIKLQ